MILKCGTLHLHDCKFRQALEKVCGLKTSIKSNFKFSPPVQVPLRCQKIGQLVLVEILNIDSDTIFRYP